MSSLRRETVGAAVVRQIEEREDLLRKTQTVLALAIEKLGGELVVTDQELVAIGSAGAQLVAERSELEPEKTSFRVRRVVSA